MRSRPPTQTSGNVGEAPIETSSRETAIAERPARILAIEDDADFRDSLCHALGDLGFDVRGARDGESGIDLFRRDGADAVLLDLGLPGMDGVSTCQVLKHLAGDAFLPVIFLTGRSDVATKVRVLEEGGDDFCVKPSAVDELAVRLRVLLRIRHREAGVLRESSRFRQYALVDPLTELGNRRAFESALDREWARMERVARPLALVTADIDRFKAFNDRYGHGTGDEVLKQVGKAIERAVRQSDHSFRVGGEEFAVLLPETTRDGALLVAERIRESVALERIGPLSVTISLGIAIAPDPIPARAAFVAAADRALYAAKAAGRNRVVATGRRAARASAPAYIPGKTAEVRAIGHGAHLHDTAKGKIGEGKT